MATQHRYSAQPMCREAGNAKQRMIDQGGAAHHCRRTGL